MGDKLVKYYESKKWEYENIKEEQTEYNEGILLGLKIAIRLQIEEILEKCEEM